MEKQKEIFEGHYEIVNGKKVLVVKARVETKKNENGGTDVIVHAPAISVGNKIPKVGK